ncbi:HlyD family efflux transporter periplasmic adaptor subunit, partial [bacterium]|nr:HlyD family efflux transporter periplasmic adaptor subunit [bacterium]
LHEAGTVIAANTVAMDSPGWGGSQRITWLVAEGTRVVPGDTLVRFDSTEFDEYMQQYRDDRDVAVMAVASARAQGSANATRARNAIAKARLAWERAQLELENQRFESRTVRESSELAGRQAEIDLKQSLRDSTAQATLDSLEIAQAELRAAKEQARVNRLQTYLDELTLTARESGMVVYHREYTEEGIKVLRAGDEVSRQAPVLEVTDTSAMRVRFTVHESDRWRLAPGQPVRIVLDAYATTEYPGEILSVGRLPLSAEEGSVARRFEAVAAIDGQDPRLKPGMSARVIIPLGGTP